MKKIRCIVAVYCVLGMGKLYAMEAAVQEAALATVQEADGRMGSDDLTNTAYVVDRAQKQDEDGTASDRDVKETSNQLASKYQAKIGKEADEMVMLIRKKEALIEITKEISEAKQELETFKHGVRITQSAVESLKRKIQKIQSLQSSGSERDDALPGASGREGSAGCVPQVDADVTSVLGEGLEERRAKIEALRAGNEEYEGILEVQVAQLEKLLATKSADTDQAAETLSATQESLKVVKERICKHDERYGENAGLTQLVDDMKEEEDISHLAQKDVEGQQSKGSWCALL